MKSADIIVLEEAKLTKSKSPKRERFFPAYRDANKVLRIEPYIRAARLARLFASITEIERRFK